MMNIHLAQLSILQHIENSVVTSKMVLLNSNNQIYSYENTSTSTTISKEWLPSGSDGLVSSPTTYDILTIHFSNANTIVIGTMRNGPHSISLD